MLIRNLIFILAGFTLPACAIAQQYSEQGTELCLGCHDLHHLPDKVLGDAANQTSVCTTCHILQDQDTHTRNQHLLDNSRCVDCHNPHASANTRD